MGSLRKLGLIPILMLVWAFDYPIDSNSYLIPFDDAVYDIVGDNPEIEVIAEGYIFTEGPAWHAVLGKLYFSDIANNKMYIWSETGGATLELDPSGTNENIEGFSQPGINGILVVPSTGELLVANHGLQALQLIDPISKDRQTLTNGFQGKKFNSPNDITLAQDGTIYFTDPPYGLEGWNDSPLKELQFNGVYKRSTEGTVTLIDDTLTMPNGIHLSPDENYLFVAVSDAMNPAIYRYERQDDGNFGERKLWFDARSFLGERYNGTTDGLTVRSDGTVFATGPGGIIIIDPSGRELGQIVFDRPVANCTLGENEKSLFATVSERVVRIKLP